ncbi:MAG: epoxyqueuosine reductase QueH [Clostridiales bacterium]|nr:epoxyqueuosine reductase QueH [Clostridiales bacterium]
MNFQQEQDNIIKGLTFKPRLLLHSCCGPCSSYCIEALIKHFDVTVLWYNPNIQPKSEYDLRLTNQIKLIKEFEKQGKLTLIEIPYDEQEFFSYVLGLEQEKEGGKRCTECFKLRLNQTAKIAKEQNFDYFTTTLTVSPHKNAPLINEIGYSLAEKYSTKFLPCDFKKKNGYKRSIELSKQLNIYRQNYCGCIFSLNE